MVYYHIQINTFNIVWQRISHVAPSIIMIFQSLQQARFNVYNIKFCGTVVDLKEVTIISHTIITS